MSHEAVTPITITSHNPNGGWKGYLRGTAWSQWIDECLMSMMGGIPWQVGNFSLIFMVLNLYSKSLFYVKPILTKGQEMLPSTSHRHHNDIMDSTSDFCIN